MNEVKAPEVKMAVDEAQVTALSKEIEPVLQLAQDFQVTDLVSYEAAMKHGQTCVMLSGRWEKLYAEGRDMAHGLHKWFCDRIKDKKSPLETAAGMFGKKARDWKRIEDDRLRVEAERKRKEEEKRVADERLRQAEALAARGHEKLADAVLAKPINVEVQAPVPFRAPAGSQVRERWMWEVEDEGKIPTVYWMRVLNRQMIDAQVKSMKAAAKIPGVRIWNEGSTAFSRK